MTRSFSLDDSPFAGRSGKGVRVAVIDSGVALPHPHVTGVVGGAWVGIDPLDHSIRVVDGAFADRIGHGTAVAAAIQEKAPSAELYALKVFDRKLATSSPVLAAALRLAAERGARLINLSLGTTNVEHAALLEAAVRDASARGALVVSALRSDGAPCFPGALEGVLGVELDAGCERGEIQVSAGRPGSVLASPYPRPIPGVPPERNLSGISFAVANATGFLARLLEATGASSADDVLQAFDTTT